jgi:anaerobic magnesium-protoporphyrin IX monomethyl ester cyclase
VGLTYHRPDGEEEGTVDRRGDRRDDRRGGGAPPGPDILLTHGYYLSSDKVEQRVMKPYPPLGILYLSAWLKQAGFRVEVLDTTFLNPVGYQLRLAEVRPKTVGIYATVITRQNVLRMVGDAVGFGIPVIVGGPDPAQYLDHYLRAGAAAVALGEGEETLAEWLAIALDQGTDAGEMDEVAGLVLPRDGGLHRTAPRPAIKDLDLLPWPDRKAIDFQHYLRSWRSRHGEASISILTARGCPFDCSWCSREVFGQTHRQRDPGDVARELKQIKEQYQPDAVWIADDVLTLNRKWVARFAEAVEAEDAVIPFECLSRVDCIDRETIATLKRIGCFRIWYGAESGAQHVIDRMNKKFTLEQVREATAMTREAGIEVGHFIMLGYPGETRRDILATVRFLKETKPDHFGPSVAFPIKGTQFYEEVKDRVVEDQVWSQRNQNRLMFRGRYPAMFYWFAIRLVNNEVPLFNRYLPGWRQPLNLVRALSAAVKSVVCRAGTLAIHLIHRRRLKP